MSEPTKRAGVRRLDAVKVKKHALGFALFAAIVAIALGAFIAPIGDAITSVFNIVQGGL